MKVSDRNDYKNRLIYIIYKIWEFIKQGYSNIMNSDWFDTAYCCLKL